MNPPTPRRPDAPSNGRPILRLLVQRRVDWSCDWCGLTYDWDSCSAWIKREPERVRMARLCPPCAMDAEAAGWTHVPPRA